MRDFTDLIDLASERLGGAVLADHERRPAHSVAGERPEPQAELDDIPVD